MSGLNKLKAAQEERKAKAASAGGGAGAFFKVPQDGEEQCRILEPLEEALSDQAAYFHVMEPVGTRKYNWFEICLDQDAEGNRVGADCPGCDANAEDWEICKRKLVVYLNVIWRDAPIRKKNEKTNKWEDTDERKDQLAVWEITQVTIQDALEQAHLTYKDITSRDFVVRRRGTGFDTTYSLNPATNDDGDAVKTPLSKEDKELIKDKEDLTGRVVLKKEADWGKPPERKPKQDSPSSAAGKASESPFLKKGKKAEETDPEDEE